MGKKMYEIGLLAKASEAEYDFETLDCEGDYGSKAEAVKEAKRLSRKCPFKDVYGRTVDAIDVTCHSDEGDEVTHYWIHWREFFVDGNMVWHLDY